MAVGWQNNQRQPPSFAPGFVSLEDVNQDYGGVPPIGFGSPGVGSQQPAPKPDPIFTPGGDQPTDANVSGGVPTPPGGDAGGDMPTPESIARRRKLAEALMGKQMEVNHPMQAIANAVSQIAGAWMEKKAGDDEKRVADNRRKMVQGSFEGSDGDIEKIMDKWLQSGDPDLVDRALDWKLKKAAGMATEGGAPTTRNFYEGNQVVTKQWNPQTRTWDPIGDPSPRWKGTPGTGGSPDAGYDYDQPPEYSTPAPPGQPPGAPGQPAPAGQPGTEPSFKTPGPRGRRAPQQGPTIQLPDGSVAPTVFNPNDGQLYYRDKDGYKLVPHDARPATPSTGGTLNPQQWRKLRQDWQEEKNSLDAIRAYLGNVKDLPTGYRRWANDLYGKIKTFMGNNNLTPTQLKQMIANGQIQGLLGMFRTTVVGPGVMTEFDAMRVIQALGGMPDSAFQNPDALYVLLQDLYKRKLANFKILDEDVKRNSAVYGHDYQPHGYPDDISGDMGNNQAGPSGPTTPRAAPPKPKGLPPKDQLKDGAIYNVNGNRLRWDAKKGKFYPA